jgi:hypothetical protein
MGWSSYPIRRMEADGTVTRWRNRDLDTKTKLPCEQCNNGWMSDLENRSIPIMKGMVVHRSPTKLQAPDIAVLSAIGFKNATLADCMQNIRIPFHSQHERKLFAQSLTFPDGVQMWLATMERQHGLFTNYYTFSKPKRRVSFDGHVFTYGAGHFVIQVASWRWSKKTRRRNYPPPFATQNPFWDTYSIPLWPSDGSVISWPPIAHLSDQMVYRFINRWSEARVTVFG